MRKAFALAVLAAALVTACTAAAGPDGPEKVVFKVAGGIESEGPAPVHEILDLGLPPLHNISNSTVRLRSVQIVSRSPAVQVVNVRAYEWRRVGVGWIQSAFGDLPKQCPSEFVPQPLSTALTRPHSDSRWMVIIAVKISKPGTYHLQKVKINYITDGKNGWQYQNLDTVIHAFHGRHPGSGC